MRPWTRARRAALALALAGCLARSPELDPERFGAARDGVGAEAVAARAVVAAFIAAEAGADPAADTLLTTDAEFVASGIALTTRPRLAALNGPGTGAVEAATTRVTDAGVAWLAVVYRFDARTPALSDRGRATFILEKRRAGWRIRHVHSSAVERW